MFLAVPGQAAVIFTVGTVGQQESTVCTNCAETFNDETLGSATSIGLEFGDTGITGTISTTGVPSGYRMAVKAADQYGGANGSRYLEGPLNPYLTSTMTLNLSQSVNYLGLWLSAIDGYNQITLYSGSTVVGTYTSTGQIRPAINATGNASSYLGNPNTAFLGQDNEEQFAYLNFTGTGGTMFDSIQFVQTEQHRGFELDNISVAKLTTPDPPTETPEPVTSAAIAGGLILLAGLGRRVTRRAK
jgi:hypothetical protein